jgi:hypothetical protein
VVASLTRLTLAPHRQTLRRHSMAMALAFATALGCATSSHAQSPPSPPEGSLYRCPDLRQVLVRSAALADAQTACEGAERALQFFARLGLVPPPSMAIDIERELPGALAGRAVGCYLRESKRIVLLSYEAFAASGPWFRTPPTRELYRSVASHEAAHAVLACHTEAAPLPTAAHEYVAYVALFATMDDSLRESLLSKFESRGFGSTLEINDVSHLVNPNQFGVNAWRHYQKRRDKDAWLREMIDGRIVDDLKGEAP